MICLLLGLWYSRHFVVSMAEDQRRGWLFGCLLGAKYHINKNTNRSKMEGW